MTNALRGFFLMYLNLLNKQLTYLHRPRKTKTH